jgi:hypothetical protein
VWKVYYTGMQRSEMHRWLSTRLNPSIHVTLGILQHDLTHHLPEMPSPLLIPLSSSHSTPTAIWILWTSPKAGLFYAGTDSDCIERVRQTLEAVLEVEEREAHFFATRSPLYDRNLIEDLVHGDPHALSTFLSLTRVLAAADFTFWGRAYQDVVEVSDHLGPETAGLASPSRAGREWEAASPLMESQ